MADWQFGVMVVLLLVLIWRTRAVAQLSPWHRDALLHRLFAKLNGIEAAILQGRLRVGEIEKDDELWWLTERKKEMGRPKGWPWGVRRKSGPWMREDWNTPGVRRLDEVEIEHEARRKKEASENADPARGENPLKDEPEDAPRTEC